MVDRLRRAGAVVHRISVDGGVVNARRESSRLPGAALLAATRDVRRLLREVRPAVVHAHSLKSGLVAGTAARSAGLPFVWHVHDRITADYLPPTTVGLLRMALRVLPDATAANSQHTLATFRSRGPRVVVPNPVPPPPQAVRVRTGPATVFGIVGRITPWKGQDLFLRAFAKAFPDGPERAVIVGEALFGETSFGTEIRRLVAELGLTGRVELRGFREDVWGELAGLDVLVHASRIPEPFGLVIVEGLLSGLPVIAMDAAGPREVLAGSPSARLVKLGDVAALADAMATIGSGPSNEEVAAVGARFAPAAAAAAVAQLYDDVVA